MGGASAAAAAAEAPAIPLECEVITLGASSAHPLDWVPIRGLPAGFDGILYAEIRSINDTATSYAFTGSDSSGAHFLQTPIHPGGTLEGGAAEVRLTDGVTQCPAISFAIEPLAPAPGTFDRVVAQVRRFVRAQAAVFGATPEELRRSDPDELPPPLVPLWLAQAAIDDSIATDAGAGRDLLDALMARISIADSIAALVDQIDSLRTLPGGDPAGLRSGFRVAAAGAPRSRSIFSYASFSYTTSRPAAAAASVAVEPFVWPASELDRAMSLALSADIGTTGRAADILSAFSDLLSLAAMSMKVLKQKEAAAGFAAVGTLAFGYQQAALAAAKLLPRRFTNLTVELSQRSFAEDDEGPGSWEKAIVTATSEGWSVDQAVLQTLLQAAGTNKAGGMSRKFKWLDDAGRLGELGYDLGHFVAGGRINTIIGVVTGKDGVVHLGPYTFVSDITDPAWRDVNYAGGAVQPVTGSKGRQYEPVAVGSSTLIISTPPKKFGFQLVRREETIVVERIDMAITLPREVVEPTEVVQFTVTVDNALNGAVKFEPTAGEVFDEQHTAKGPDSHEWRVSLRTPAAEDRYPVRLKVTSMADRSHLRRVEERSATARIDLAQLELRPTSACVLPDSSQVITAYFAGEPATNVRWATDAGRIDDEGRFSPPGGSGTATVTAVDRDNPELRGEAEFRYGADCDQAWTAIISGGPHAGSHGGSQARAVFMGGRLVSVRLDSDAGATPNLHVEINATERRPFSLGQASLLTSPHQLGLIIAPKGSRWEAVNDGTAVSYGSGSGTDSRFPAGVSAEFRMMGDSVVVGTAGGRVYRSDTRTPEVGSATVQIDFRAKAVRQ